MKRVFKIGLCMIVLLILILSLPYVSTLKRNVQEVIKDEIITFNKTFGEAIFSEYGYSVKETPDGGFIIVGSKKYRELDREVWLIKLDEKGTEEWNTTVNGKDYDYGIDVLPLSDGNYIISGYSKKKDRWFSYTWVMKIDNQGNMIWNRTIEFYHGLHSPPSFHVIIAQNYGYQILIGHSVWVDQMIMTDLFGNTIDVNLVFGGDIVTQTSDNGYIHLSELGLNTMALFKRDSDFQIIWMKKYQKSAQLNLDSICQLRDDSFIFTGVNYSQKNGIPQIMKTDVDGNILWEKKVVITRGWVQDYQVTDTDDGGFLIYPMDSRIIVKMDDKGNKIWERDNKTIPIYGCKMAYQTKDGGYIVLGNTWDDSLYEYEDIILLKLDSNGLLHEDHPHTTTEPDWPYLLAIIGILVLITADIIVLASILKKKRKCA